MSKLTAKQENFCQQLAVHGKHKAEAYRIAYDTENMAESTIYRSANELLKNHKVTARLQELYAQAENKLQITHDQLLRKLKNWFEADITEAMCLEPEEVKELPLEFRQLITSFKYKSTPTEFGEIREAELKFVSKEKAAEMIAKMIGAYEAHNQQKTQDNKIELTIHGSKSSLMDKILKDENGE